MSAEDLAQGARLPGANSPRGSLAHPGQGARAAAPALLIVGHGTRDADGLAEFHALASLVREAAGSLPVETGFIELAEPLVDEAVDRLIARGPRDVVSVPLVLLAAGHLKNDGPASLERARVRHPGVTFRLGRDLGIDPAVLAVAEDRIRSVLPPDHDPATTGVVLVGRGSSDPDACGDLYKVARLLADGRGLGMVEPAFAGVAQPDVPAALERLRRLGATTVVVAPLLLFTGVLVGRLHATAAAWAEDHADLDVRAAPHLGPDRRLAKLVLERYREVLQGDVRMNCDLCTYRVRLPGYEDKVGLPISLTPHGDAPAGGRRRARRPTRAPRPAPAALAMPARERALHPSTPTAAADPAAPPAVALRRLSYAYPDGTAVLTNVDLTIASGERVAILGPNGAGKTTLALQLNGMLDGATGDVEIGGTRLGPSTRRDIRRRVGLVFQDPDDQLFLPTVRADVAFGPANLGLSGDALRARVDEALARVAIAELADRPPHLLSAGERRRAALAGVLAMEPDVLVLDEPSSSLDPAARRELADVLVSLSLTTLLVTHDLPYALELCPRAIVLDQGQVVADGPTREVLADEGFMRAHRLELPAGFNPLAA
ncbi:MAG TPA: CbiX/SirB N-terminal domain-containing protein [Baekduia sp.]|nr:CbiX/SirB N-terminal domain-containing protein [Baekduia sp.]HMJ33430.1 CbiX/SirB N-terminal domain-containing protein [Baekduia sp.]